MSKQIELENPDLKQQINFVGRLNEDNTKVFFIIEKSEETTFELSENAATVINDQNNTEYGEGNKDDSSIKLETKVIKSSICHYSDAYILGTGDLAATRGGADTNVVFKNFAQFTRCITHINTGNNLDITMLMYNLIEYSDTSRSLWEFERDESL